MVREGHIKRYIIGNRVLAIEHRDRFRRLSRPHTYRNLKPHEPRVGEEGVYVVELTEAEARELRRNPPANMRYLTEDRPIVPDVTAQVPAQNELTAMKAGVMHSQGFTGAGIVVGVIDAEGIGSGALALFNVKAARDEGGGAATDAPNNHGSNTASLAVPRSSQLVFSRADSSSEVISALYWQADVQAVDVINMSFSNNPPTASDPAEADAIANALSAGIQLFASAGNSGTSTPQYPAAYDGVVAVGSLNGRGSEAKASFSNHGSWVELWVNGVDIVTYNEAGNLETDSGTSLSAPLAVHTFASKLTKGKSTIGPEKTLEAMLEGTDAGPQGESGGVLNANKGLGAMPSKCA